MTDSDRAAIRSAEQLVLVANSGLVRALDKLNTEVDWLGASSHTLATALAQIEQAIELTGRATANMSAEVGWMP